MNALDVEIESGTYSGQARQHNGYYAGDFCESYTSVRHRSVAGQAGVLLSGQPGGTRRDLALLVVGVAERAGS
jgi:hypothetical protein